MVGSSKTVAFADQSSTMVMLNVKPWQNLILSLTASRYNEALRPMIECLRFSPLAQALTMEESIPLVHLSKAYCLLLKIQGFDATKGLVDPDSISSSNLIHMLYQMG
ncbi:unnamed protein product [Lactuca saligna]|uniref:Uncharacterized protein n=1 Tax=Lactuca saligna TaxID=75948 RepID=A0AA35Z4A8_LACSI|nr:unnamed protein product [Lactuca saligna]